MPKPLLGTDTKSEYFSLVANGLESYIPWLDLKLLSELDRNAAIKKRLILGRVGGVELNFVGQLAAGITPILNQKDLT